MWILQSFGMFMSSIVMYLFIRYSRVLKMDRKLVSIAIFIFPTIFALYFLVKDPSLFNLSIPLIIISILIAFFASFIGNIFSFKGMEQAPNPGYSLVIQKSYAIFTSIVSVYAFGTELNIFKFGAILTIILGISIIIISEQNNKNLGIKSNKWIIYSIYCFFAFGIFSLFSKWMITNMHVPIFTRIFYSNFFITILAIIDYVYPKFKLPKIEINYKTLITFIAVGITSALFTLFLQQSRVSAPNPGYADAINSSSNTFLTLFAAFLFKDHLGFAKLIGIVITTIGLIILVT